MNADDTCTTGLQDNSPIINKNQNDTADNDMKTGQTEYNDSSVTKTSQNIRIPENINPLPNGSWHKAEDIYKIIIEKRCVHNDVPSGYKRNCRWNF